MLYPWQKTQWKSISQQIQQQRLPHALILTGVVGLGKLTLANHIVAKVLCENTHEHDACGSCHSCQLFIAGNHPDHTFIEPEDEGKLIKIEQIRSLKDKQELTPTIAKWKTVIISPAENMNINANNSLLKLLEEPQQNTLLVLVSAKPERLPITILSRCHKITFNVPDTKSAFSFVQQSSVLKEHDISTLLELAKGAPLAALTLHESNIIEHLSQLDKDFESLLAKQANPVSLTKSWLQYDHLIVFNYLQNTVKKKLIQLQNKDDKTKSKQYWVIYDCIIEAIKLTSSSNNINKTLLIEQFMVSIMDGNLDKLSAINS